MNRGMHRKDRSNVILAGLFTLATFVGLPLAHYLGPGGAAGEKTFEIGLAEPPPLSAPPPPRRSRKEIKRPVSIPTLEHPREIVPRPAILRLDLALGDLAGDFAIDPGIFHPRIVTDPEDDAFGISETDTQPKAIHRASPFYPPQARMRKIEGHVRVEFIVGTDGKVRGAEVTESQPEGVFDAAALQAVRRWRFKSGVKGGKSVPVRVRQTVHFTLER